VQNAPFQCAWDLPACHPMLSDRLLHCGNSVLWKLCVAEQVSCHLRTDQCVVSTMMAFAFLSQVMESYRRPYGRQVPSFVCLDRLGKSYRAYNVDVIVGCILCPFAFHHLIGKLEQPATKFFHQ